MFYKIIFEYEKTDVAGIQLTTHMMNNVAGTSFWMCKKQALLDVGMFESISAHNDGVVILKLMANGYSVDLVRECLVDYYVHKGKDGITAISYDTLQADVDYLNICRRYFSLLTEKERQMVVDHYYDDRNWNLIILRDKELCIKDFGYMHRDGISLTTRFRCMMRYIFKRFTIAKENKRLKYRGLE